MISIKIKKLKFENTLNLPHTVSEFIEWTCNKYAKEYALKLLKPILHSDYTNTVSFIYTSSDNQTYTLYISPQYYPYGMIDLSCHDLYADIAHKNHIGSINEIVSILEISKILLGENNDLVNKFCYIVEESFSQQNYSNHQRGLYIVNKLKDCNIYIEFLNCLNELKKDYIKYCIKEKIQKS